MPSGMQAQLALSEWRRAERELLAADPLSDDASRLAQEVDLLRAQYHETAGSSAPGRAAANLDSSLRASPNALGGRDDLRDRLIGDGLGAEEAAGWANAWEGSGSQPDSHDFWARGRDWVLAEFRRSPRGRRTPSDSHRAWTCRPSPPKRP
jgi:hypothetical protein